MILKVKGTKVRWKNDQDGCQVSDDGGLTWYFTFRGEQEFRQMWNKYQIIESRTQQDLDDLYDSDLEVFGDTLDEPIPQDLADMLGGQ